MVSAAQPDLLGVDWSRIPAPVDDGGARHLLGLSIPDCPLPATDGTQVSLGALAGRTVVFVYPRTGIPGQVSVVDGWDEIPGARGCTPQACSFRDLHTELTQAGADRVYGLSVQDTAYQEEAAQRLHLPFPLLSDSALKLTHRIGLPVMVVGTPPATHELLRRMALVIDDARIIKVFYPVFPPDRNAADVLAWLRANARGIR